MPQHTLSSDSTITARPLSFAEIEAIVASPEPVEVYTLTEIGTLTPATVRVTGPRGQSRRGRNQSAGDRGAYYAPVPVERGGKTVYEPDTEQGPIGYGYTLEGTTVLGSGVGGTVFTTAEAEKSALLIEGHSEPSRARLTTYVPDDKGGTAMPLTPIWGAQVSLSAVVADIDAETLAERVERALREEFGDNLGQFVKVKTRLVEDRRVDVRDATTKDVLALNILHAEVPAIMEHAIGGVETTPASGRSVVIGGQ